MNVIPHFHCYCGQNIEIPDRDCDVGCICGIDYRIKWIHDEVLITRLQSSTAGWK